jgi:hypothetical protein
VIVDESFGTTGQGYQLTRIHHLGEHTVRIEIRYDTYEQQSHATAAVLNAEKTWTTVVSDPPSNWHDATPSPYTRPVPTARTLYPLAERLAHRAAVVLRTPPPATTPPLATTPPPATRPRRASTARSDHGGTR